MEARKRTSHWLNVMQAKDMFRGMQRHLDEIFDHERPVFCHDLAWRREELIFLRELRNRSKKSSRRSEKRRSDKTFEDAERVLRLDEQDCAENPFAEDKRVSGKNLGESDMITVPVIRCLKSDEHIAHVSTQKEMAEKYMEEAMKTKLCTVIYPSESDEGGYNERYNERCVSTIR